MAFKHNYINTKGFKPLASEIEALELVPNYADGTLWTKNLAGTVMSLGDRDCGDWVFPNITSPYYSSSVLIPNAEKLKYKLLDLQSVIVIGSFTLTGFPFGKWMTIFTLPQNIAGNIQGLCHGVAKIFNYNTAAVKVLIDLDGNVRVWIGENYLNTNNQQRVFVQVAGRRV